MSRNNFILYKDSIYKNRILFITENVYWHEANKVDTILTTIGLRNASMLLTLSKSVEEEVGRFVYGRKIYRSELPRYDYYQSNHKEKIQAFNSKLGIGEDDQALMFSVL